MHQYTVDTRIPFTGRVDELRRLTALLESRSSIVITGAGGVGKSRLALETVRRWTAENGHGMRFITLAGVAPEEIAGTVAAALDIAREPDRSALATLTDATLPGPQTIVLDNCEDAVDEVRDVIVSLLRHPEITVLATSRVPISSGLVRFDLRPFDAIEGSAFFMARARLANIVIDPQSDDAAAVRSIVERLDGLAVAIDLAAARLLSISVRQLADELTELRPYHLRSMASSDRRHWTLNHVVSWTLDKLDRETLNVFTIAGRFANVFGLDDIVGVCNGVKREPADSFEELVTHSLVARIEGERGYMILAPIRAVARRRLERRRDREAINERFALHMDTIGLELFTRVETAEGGLVLAKIAERYDDFISVLAWALEQPAKRIPMTINAVAALAALWSEGGRCAEGLHWFDRILAIADQLEQHIRGRLYFGTVRAALMSCEYERVVQLGPQLISTFTITNDRVRLAQTYDVLSVAALYTGYADEAQIYSDTALQLYKSSGDHVGYASALLNQGCIAMDGRHDPVAARAYFLQGIELLSHSGGADTLISLANGNLAEAAAQSGDLQEMEYRANLALDGFARLGHIARGAWARCLLAYTQTARGDRHTAAREISTALELLEHEANPDYLARCVEATASLLFAEKRSEESARLALAAARFRLERRVPAIGLGLGDPERERNQILQTLDGEQLARVTARAKAFELKNLGPYARRALAETFEA